MKKHHLILILISLVFVQSPQARETINGRVTDATNNEPLLGATVMSGADTTTTDTNGGFSITIERFPSTLSVQFLGYKTSEIVVYDNQRLRVSLQPSTLALNEVVVTSGSQKYRIRNTVGNMDLISESMLQRDQPFSITSALNRVPGVYMHSGTFNTNRITIRGVGSRSLYGTDKIKAYYDQIPLTDGSGNSTIEDIDQALIDRIEVVKGPNSSLYGAGLAGVVRLYSDHAESNQTSLESSLTIGSYATLRWMNRFSQSDDKKSISLVHSKMRSDGYRENSEYDRDQIGITSRFYLDENSYVSFLGFYTSLKAYIPSSIDLDVFQNDPKAAAANWAEARGYEQYDKGLFGISYLSELSAHWELSSSVFFKFRDAYEPTPVYGQGILDENTISFGTRNTISYIAEKMSVTSGMELFRDSYEWSMSRNLYSDTTNGSVLGPVFSINEEDRSYSNFFVEASFRPVKRLSIIAGVNLNHTTYTLNDKFVSDSLDQNGDYSFDPVLSPRMGASYAVSPTSSIYLNVSHGFSPPGLDETLYPDGQINTNIQPETGWNFESGVRGNISGFNYDASIYLMLIQNLIVAERVGENQYVGVNAGVNSHAGIDLYTSYFLPIHQSYTLNIFSSFSWMHYRFTRFIHQESDYSGNQLTGIPQVTFNPGVELISESGLYGNVTGQYTGEIPMNDENSLYAEDYLILRTKVGYRLRSTHWEADLSAGIDNITDERYASMLLINAIGFGGNPPRYYYPGLPRNYFGGITIKYLF